MTNALIPAAFQFDKDQNLFRCVGSWVTIQLDTILPQLSELSDHTELVSIDVSDVQHLDTAGALAILQLKSNFADATQIIGFNSTQQELFNLVEKQKKYINYVIPPVIKPNLLAQLGEESCAKARQSDDFIVLLGDLSAKFFEALSEWRRFQWPSIASNMQHAGINALPIVGLLAFLIGVVLAYQMGLQLQTYGANIFIAFLSGMAIFREFGPLITAIIVAGRTSSAFTAQIGSMVVNEEVDAIRTMGLSPIELLVMPKMFGLLLIFPLLIFWADFFGLIGAMCMSKTMLNVGYIDFLARLKESVGLKQLMLGLYKAPTFAIIIALVGCFQGFRVQANADSVGTQTTKSVVQALFLIIVADALYSIIYSWMGI
ncbi:MAG: ABC transporter permease [Legionellaceae bacterium]|nr:ABC transporter permease [Legionellaceae bacterium]